MNVDPAASRYVLRADNPWLKQNKVQRISSADSDNWQSFQGALFDGVAKIPGAAYLDHFSRAGDLNHFLDPASLEGHIDRRRLVDISRIPSGNELLETLPLNCNRVLANLYRVEDIASAVRSFCRERELCRLIGERYGGAGTDAPFSSEADDGTRDAVPCPRAIELEQTNIRIESKRVRRVLFLIFETP